MSSQYRHQNSLRTLCLNSFALSCICVTDMNLWAPPTQHWALCQPNVKSVSPGSGNSLSAEVKEVRKVLTATVTGEKNFPKQRQKNQMIIYLGTHYRVLVPVLNSVSLSKV